MDEEIKRKRPRKAKQEQTFEPIDSEFPGLNDEPQEEKPEKIVEAKLPEKPKAQVRKPERRNNLHRVIVKGKERYLSNIAIMAASRDKKLDLQIPEDSTFQLASEPKFKKCKDC